LISLLCQEHAHTRLVLGEHKHITVGIDNEKCLIHAVLLSVLNPKLQPQIQIFVSADSQQLHRHRGLIEHKYDAENSK